MKLHKLYRISYTEGTFTKKILGKIRIPADKSAVNRLVVKGTHPKNGKTLYSFDVSKAADKKTIANLNRIAKDITKQKGRLNITSLALAVIVLAAVILAVALFRNVIARKVITASLEGAFGAKCEIATVDLGFFDTRMHIAGLSVASKDKPMKNLFEIGDFLLDFDLLELTRAKLVADEVKITGITWNTDRTTSGELPPKKQKKQDAREAAPNPILAAILSEAGKVSSGISVDAGLAAVQDQLDPVKIIERERANLSSPAITKKISETVPQLSEKWEAKSVEARKLADTSLEKVKGLSSINVDSIKTIEEARKLVSEIDTASKALNDAISFAKTTSAEASRDGKTVSSLTAEAEAALKADQERLVKLADKIKSFDLDAGKGIVSSAFNTFIVSTLGAYYPYFDKGLSAFRASQVAKKNERSQPLKQKENPIERLPGRNFSFGSASLPSVLFRSVELSAHDAAVGISGEGSIKNLTNDADRLGKPVSFDLSAKHGKMGETVTGIVDARTGAEPIVDAAFDVKGYKLSIDSGSEAGMPSIAGNSTITGKLFVKGTNEVQIRSKIAVANAKLSINSFNPAFLYRASKDAIANVRDVTVSATVDITPEGNFSLALGTDIDEKINRAIRDSVSGKIADVKASVKKEAYAYVEAERKKYLSHVNEFTASSKKSLAAIQDIKAGEKALATKKAEAEKRVTQLLTGQIVPKKTDGINPVNSLLKKIP